MGPQAKDARPPPAPPCLCPSSAAGSKSCCNYQAGSIRHMAPLAHLQPTPACSSLSASRSYRSVTDGWRPVPFVHTSGVRAKLGWASEHQYQLGTASAGCHGRIGLGCYWRRLLSGATHKESLVSPRIAASALCDTTSGSSELLMSTSCELNKFAFDRDAKLFLSLCCLPARARACLCTCAYIEALTDRLGVHA